MSPVELVPFLAVLVLAAGFVSAPIRAARRPAAETADLAALEAERDARLAAIRDAELDLQTGKLSAADHRVLDARLRVEALDALAAIDDAVAAREEEER